MTRAALLKARAPHREVVFGSISRSAPADLSTIVGMNACKMSVMYRFTDVPRSESLRLA